MNKLLLISIFLISFSSIGQTVEIDKLKAIWIDEMIEFGDISIKNIDWTATFVPYYKTRENVIGQSVYNDYETELTMILNKVGFQVGDYYTEKIAKDANNREMTLASNRIPRGRYWMDFENFRSIYDAPLKITITDSKNNFEIVGTISFDIKIKTYKNYNQAYRKYLRKNKVDRRRWVSTEQVLFEEILKRYKI